MIECCDVPVAHIPFIWPKIEGFVTRSLATDECARYWPVDIYKLLLTVESKLWVAYDRDPQEFVGFVITQVIVWPRMRECRAWLIGGKRLREWQTAMREMIEAYARAHNCSYNTGFGRPGWTRMPGYKKSGIIIQKAL
jgi:hypothetical protein